MLNFSILGKNMMDENIIDQKVIQNLKDLESPKRPNIVKELITLFILTADPIAEKINTSTNDMQALSISAHTLKSAAAAVGALRLSKICFELEQIGLSKLPVENLEHKIDLFNIEYKLAIEALKCFLA